MEENLQKIIDNTGLTKEQIYKILMEKSKFKPKIINEYFRTSSFKIGVVSDTHLGSWYECLDELHTFYELCRKKNVKAIVHAGDLVDGVSMYRGQENEIHTFGADRQVDYCVEHYPKINNIKTYFIDGNHDQSHWKKGGVDVGKKISEQRSDMVYMGMSQADVVLNGIKIRLLHPSGGGA